ncbi:MAG TPA: hypothetical protein VGC82_03595, partial [Rhodopila sp.]
PARSAEVPGDVLPASGDRGTSGGCCAKCSWFDGAANGVGQHGKPSADDETRWARSSGQRDGDPVIFEGRDGGAYSVMRSNPAKLLPDVGCYCLISINKKHSVGSGVFLWTPPVF